MRKNVFISPETLQYQEEKYKLLEDKQIILAEPFLCTWLKELINAL